MRERNMHTSELVNKLDRLDRLRAHYNKTLMMYQKIDPDLVINKFLVEQQTKNVNRIDKWRGRLELRLRGLQDGGMTRTVPLSYPVGYLDAFN